jgi:hypothetical protein
MFIKERKFAKGKPLTEGMIRELIDEGVRKAVGEQARELETHLADLHRRLVFVEKTTRR